jgi:Uma2 family endonuclease
VQIEVEPPFTLVKPVDDEGEYYDRLDEDAPWELLDGRLVMSPASQRHEELFRFLLTIIGGHLDERGGGVALGSRFPMRLDARWSPEPDVLVVLDAHRDRLTEQRLEGPADLVVEIASEGDPRLDEREKLPRYREAALPEIWLVRPDRRVVRVDRRRADGGYDTIELAEGRLASTVVEGLWIDVAWLWQEPLPSAIACLRRILGD